MQLNLYVRRKCEMSASNERKIFLELKSEFMLERYFSKVLLVSLIQAESIVFSKFSTELYISGVSESNMINSENMSVCVCMWHELYWLSYKSRTTE